MRTLLGTLIPASPLQLYFGRCVRFAHKFIKPAFVSRVDSIINLHANIFGISYEVGVLQNNHLKNDITLDFIIPTSYVVMIHCEN